MTAAKSPRTVPFLYALFLLSGAAGLCYESVWSRYLGLFVGHAAYAQVLVLAIFLGGMSLGAALISRRARTIARPLMAYAVMEAVAGLIGLGFRMTCSTSSRGRISGAASGAREQTDAHRRHMEHRGPADPAAIDPARHHLPR
jgi:hypothetical protein